MGHRFTMTATKDEIEHRFEVTQLHFQIKPCYNISSHRKIPVIIKNSTVQLYGMQWGLKPTWGRRGLELINCRRESLKTKPRLYRSLFEKNRCLVVADGFFEWRRSAKTKGPTYFRLKSKKLFSFAGLYNIRKVSGLEIMTCGIITTEPNELVRPVHDRMFAMLRLEHEEQWLNIDADPDQLHPFLDPYPAKEMEAFKVSSLVNDYRNNSPECVEPVS